MFNSEDSCGTVYHITKALCPAWDCEPILSAERHLAGIAQYAALHLHLAQYAALPIHLVQFAAVCIASLHPATRAGHQRPTTKAVCNNKRTF